MTGSAVWQPHAQIVSRIRHRADAAEICRLAKSGPIGNSSGHGAAHWCNRYTDRPSPPAGELPPHGTGPDHAALRPHGRRRRMARLRDLDAARRGGVLGLPPRRRTPDLQDRETPGAGQPAGAIRGHRHGRAGAQARARAEGGAAGAGEEADPGGRRLSRRRARGRRRDASGGDIFIQ